MIKNPKLFTPFTLLPFPRPNFYKQLIFFFLIQLVICQFGEKITSYVCQIIHINNNSIAFPKNLHKFISIVYC